MMACVPLKNSEITIQNGWLFPRGGEAGKIEILPSSQALLSTSRLDVTNCDIMMCTTTCVEKLPHQPRLPDMLKASLADIERMGCPSLRGGRVGNGKKLDGQRKLKQQLQQQNGGDDAGFVEVGGRKKAEDNRNSVDKRTVRTLNSLRVLIGIMRPILDNPRRKDEKLIMEDGPSISDSSNGKGHQYLISKNVFSLTASGKVGDIQGAFRRLMCNLFEENIWAKVVEKGENEQYSLTAGELVESLLKQEAHPLAKMCLDLPNINLQAVAKLDTTMVKCFEIQHDEKQYQLQQSINATVDKLEQHIAKKFRGTALTVYGSCLSGLAIEGSHDVDISVHIPELYDLRQSFESGHINGDSYAKKMKNILFTIKRCLESSRSNRFENVFAIHQARVPVVKGIDMDARNPFSEDGRLHFDLCFLNSIAVVNSSLIREYSLFENVRVLMLSVKSFAKLNRVASAADGTASSYTWMVLVIFYLQCLGYVPNLQCPNLLEEHDFEVDPTNPWHAVGGLNTCFLTRDAIRKKNTWKRGCPIVFETSPSSLLYGFFRFYSGLFPHAATAVSVRFGDLSLQKASFQNSSKLWRLCIEDPFETCESHICHDLGCHIDEAGQKRISTLLREACGALKELMECPSVDGDFVPEFMRLVIADEKKQSSAPKKRGKGKNGARKAKQQNDRAKNKGVADKKANEAKKAKKQQGTERQCAEDEEHSKEK